MNAENISCPANSSKGGGARTNCVCNNGYHGSLKWDRTVGTWQGNCVLYEGSCKNGMLTAVERRTQENHCGQCNHGYYLDMKQCAVYGGECKNGYLISISLRNMTNHCGSCYKGYRLENHRCVPLGGKCMHGELIDLSNRVVENHCGSCSPGFYLNATKCIACGKGRYQPQSQN